MKDAKKCGMTSECWSGFARLLGAAFIVTATILTLVTMNGLGILGMFIVGGMLCRRKCPCGPHHGHCHDEMCCHEEKPKPKPKPKKPAVKKQ
ncbi:MAG: hypothetical protein K0U37_01380 [Gammaproteobacteria bacterium]|nr:hypothetical protein [Gammaproteobacteria bacterium]